MLTNRRDQARNIRNATAQLARERPDQFHFKNGDEAVYAAANHAMSFTKGLEHDPATLLLLNGSDGAALRTAIDDGFVHTFNAIQRPPDPRPVETRKPIRKWEAPTAGFVHDLQGPDAQEVTMQAAPALGSAELIYEMAEVYELALLRDVSLSQFADGAADPKVTDAVARMNALASALGAPQHRFRRRRTVDNNDQLTPQNLFRGSSAGVEKGGYLSQFMLMGNDNLGGGAPADGNVMFGAQKISQKVPVATIDRDYMKSEADYLTVQNGIDVRDNDTLYNGDFRFITTPRDLATYVHDDALYQAYLNACLILLGQGAPFDPLFDTLSGMGASGNANTGGFALWGGPHILSLVTEVATRGLKAVRFQKFNSHLRLRPEALAARVHKFASFPDGDPWNTLKEHLHAMRAQFQDAGGASESLEAAITAKTGGTMLLPMAFQEGSPMHPSYGAGHATVAGACVTVLKAFFDTTAMLVEKDGKIGFRRPLPNGDPDGTPIAFQTEGDTLDPFVPTEALTLEGELNKLAANISIGRNMGGVHFYSDYYDSVRMGEEIAMGILEEQAMTYPKDPFILSLRTFDGDVRTFPTQALIV